MFVHLVQKSYRHFLLNVATLQCFAEIIKWYFALATLIRFHYCSLGNADQLILADIRSDHHMQYIQELVTGNRFVIIQIVHTECNWKIMGSQFKWCSQENLVRIIKFTNISISPHGCLTCWLCSCWWVGSVPALAWIYGNWRDRRCCRRKMHAQYDRTVDLWPVRECAESHHATMYHSRCDPTMWIGNRGAQFDWG